MKTVTQTQGLAQLSSYTYNTAGQLQQTSLGNGAITNYSYDGAGRLVDMSTTVTTTLVSRFQYGLDKQGQRTAVTETVQGQQRVITSSYDGLERLTGATEQPGQSTPIPMI